MRQETSTNGAGKTANGGNPGGWTQVPTGATQTDAPLFESTTLSSAPSGEQVEKYVQNHLAAERRRTFERSYNEPLLHERFEKASARSDEDWRQAITPRWQRCCAQQYQLGLLLWEASLCLSAGRYQRLLDDLAKVQPIPGLEDEESTPAWGGMQDLIHARERLLRERRADAIRYAHIMRDQRIAEIEKQHARNKARRLERAKERAKAKREAQAKAVKEAVAWAKEQKPPVVVLVVE